MADVAVLAQSPLADQPDDSAQQVSQVLLQASKRHISASDTGDSLSVHVHIVVHCLHSSSCCTCQSRHAIDSLCLEQAFRGPVWSIADML